MEERKLKINFFKSGSGSINGKAPLPITWLRKIGLVPEERDFNAYLDEENEVIILSKKELKNFKIEIIK